MAARDPVRATTDNFLRAAVFAPVAWIFARDLDVSSSGMMWAVLSGSVSSALGYVVWYAALRQLTATRAAVQLSVPVIAAAGGVLFLNEQVTLRLIVSAVAILGGIGLAVTGRPAAVSTATRPRDTRGSRPASRGLSPAIQSKRD